MEKRRKTHRRIPAAPALLAAVVLLAGLAVVVRWDAIVRDAAEKSFAAERARYRARIDRLENELADLSARLRARQDGSRGWTDTPARTADATAAGGENAGEPDCRELQARITREIEAISRLPGISGHGDGPGWLMARLERIRKKLLDRPPIVVRETDSLYSILTNTAHFYRVLGRDDLMLLRALLAIDADRLEDLLAMLYQWSRRYDECGGKDAILPLPLDRLYEYAGFFLNTLGGQAYIFRRDTRTRILARYYCIMIIDRANARVINRHGIDLRPAANALFKDLEAATGLKRRGMYLENLAAIRARYPGGQTARSPLAKPGGDA